ncbi:hypothetical protein SAMD00019534_044060, partial [Acytostelium subglobosum LB1]|uniref:hypothetical protein n=1 Tax=Acytostelium subglobosum LB1 TaxID=1410327 RepID=UPI000644B378
MTMESPVLYKQNLGHDQDRAVEKRNQFLEKELEYFKSELNSTRRILNERDNLLLHLQWDEEDAHIDFEGQKKKTTHKKSKDKVLTEERQKINRLRTQMKLMETALEERDQNIMRLEKELSDTKVVHQHNIETMRAKRESPQRSKTSWGFRTASSSPLPQYKPASPSLTTSPGKMSSPLATSSSSPSSSSPSSSTTSSPAMASPSIAGTTSGATGGQSSFDAEWRKMNKKSTSVFTFKKKNKPTHSNVQDTNWNQ